MLKLSRSIKHLFYSASLLSFIIAAGLLLADQLGIPVSVTGVLSQNQLAVFLIVFSVVLIAVYHLLATMFKSDYRADPDKKSQRSDWLT